MTARMELDLSRRIALVTGAGQGVGREIARLLAAHGARVAVNDFFPDRAQAVTQEIAAAGGTAWAAPADVTDHAAMVALNLEIEAALGPVGILVNNAGNAGPDSAMPRLDFWQTDPAEWDKYLRVNLLGVMTCARACLGGMVGRRYGRVVTIISDAGRVGEQGHEAYSAAKAGAAGFSRALARATGRYGVTVNTISLSNIRREGDGTSEAVIATMLKRYIIRRQGNPRDAAAMALFLCSDEAGWITGQNYPVNGGFSLAL